MQVTVIGGSAAGLTTAMLLAREGHGVTVLERDDLQPAADVETAAATAFRAFAPQVVQPHVLLATFRLVLRDRLPDVYASLLAAGAVEASLTSQMPPSLSDRSPAPGDDDLALIMTRRATLDWVLARAAAVEPDLDVRYGVQVLGLLADPGRPPRVHGVRTSGGEDLRSDLVVDASGRRSSLDRWLAAIGARPCAVRHDECGAAYYSRQYRLVAEPPGPRTTRVIAGLDEFTIGIWGGDNATMQIALAPLVADRRFLAARDPEVFSAVVRSVPFYAAWLEVLEPLTQVAVMGGLHNTLRRLVVDGDPVVHGLLAVGDAVCTTNPTVGRGLGMAVRTAADLVDTVATHPDDPDAQARAMDELVDRNIAPWYEDQAAIDTARLTLLRHTVLGEPTSVTDTTDRLSFGELRLAAQVDPVAFRALWGLLGLLVSPSTVYDDPSMIERVRQILAGHVPATMAQPTREQLVAALSVRSPAASITAGISV